MRSGEGQAVEGGEGRCGAVRDAEGWCRAVWDRAVWDRRWRAVRGSVGQAVWDGC